MSTHDPNDVFGLFGDGSYQPSTAPIPWYPGAKMDLDDYGRVLLHHLPRGQVKAVAAPQIARRLGLPWEKNQFPLRHLVKNLVLEKGWPIGTTSVDGTLGLFLLDSETDIELYTAYLDRRIEALVALRDTVKEGWERRARSKAVGNDWPGW